MFLEQVKQCVSGSEAVLPTGRTALRQSVCRAALLSLQPVFILALENLYEGERTL